MTNEPRKASDIIISLESKVESLLEIVKNLDFSMKLLSNKLNDLAANSHKQEILQPRIVVESEKSVFISKEDTLPSETSPKGFRRTSRPETFGEDRTFNKTQEVKVLPKKQVSEIIVPTQVTQIFEQPKVSNKSDFREGELVQNAIPVSQRIVDKTGKSVFLAAVEIIDLSTNQTVFKNRTTGTGKWMASLAVGNYRVIVKKLESLTKEKIEITQEISIDGTKSPYELQTMIMK